MSAEAQPLVSVLTPVYNGAKHLRECIESVLAQTYSNWEYVIVNNCSTDGTREIAESYARCDSRVRVHNNTEFLPVIANWNNALRRMSADSKYCKFVHADDKLFPECIEKMVALAEQHPTVSIVSAFRMKGDAVAPHRLTFSGPVVSGREICRASLLSSIPHVFGSPSTLLIRADVIRSREAFYDERNFHADTESCFDVLRDSDMGFVHEVLSYSQVHEGSLTSGHQALDTDRLGRYHLMLKYGPVFLSRDEYQRRLAQRRFQYYFFLARSILTGKGAKVWAYHKAGLERLGYSLNMRQMLLYLLASSIRNPTWLVGQTLNSIRSAK